MDIRPNSKEIKVGVIGLGKMGVMHACLLNTLPNVKVAALCDKSRLMRILATRVFRDCLVTGKLSDFVNLDLDAVYILTPIPSHFQIIKEILSLNIASNIFVEKTLTSNYAHSKELCNLAHNYQGINMVGYMKRFGVTFNQAKKLLDENILGEIKSFDAYAFSSDFANAPESSVSLARGGVLEDLGSHAVDLALWFFGELTVGSSNIDSSISQNSSGSVNFEVTGLNSLQGKFQVSWCKKGYRMPEWGLAIKGADGKLTVNDDEVQLELNHETAKKWYRQDLKDNVGFLLGGPEYYREDQHFINSLISRTVPKSDFESAIKVDYLLEQVRGGATDE